MKPLIHTATLALAALFLPAWGQTPAPWPSKPLRMIVGYPAGSSPDMQARLLAPPLGQALGQPVVIENRPGAGGNIGADLIAKAQDGHTLGVVGNGPLTSAPHLYARLPYDPVKDLAPIALIGTAPLVWATRKAPDGAGGAAPFIQQARSEGERWSYGSIGAGSGGHLGMELLKGSLNFQPLHIPYNGGPAIVNALIGGQVQMTLLPASTVMPLVQAGKIDAVAVTSARRSPLAPTLPALEELGVRGVSIEVWNAVMAPASLPAAHRARLSAALEQILGTREIRQKLFEQGWRVDATGARTLAERIRSDSALYAEVIARNKIRLD